MIVVYPLGNGSNWQDKELELSINSIRMNTDVSEIYVVGEKPRCKINFNVLEYKSSYKTVAHKVADNLLYFINLVRPKSFVLMNDDFFCNNETSLKDLPLWYDKTIRERILKPGISSKYKYTLEKSIRFKDDLNFGVHFPMPIRHVSKFKDSLYECLMITNGCSFRNLYGNRVKNLEVIKERKDLKYTRHMINPEEVLQHDWFSIGDEFLLPHCRVFLINHFGKITDL